MAKYPLLIFLLSILDSYQYICPIPNRVSHKEYKSDHAISLDETVQKLYPSTIDIAFYNLASTLHSMQFFLTTVDP